MATVDRMLAATAAAQHGLLTRSQVLRAGGTDSVIRRRVQSERWERVLRSVYAITGVPWTWRRRLCALWLALGPGAVVSHRAAASILGVGGGARAPYELTVAADRVPRGRIHVPHAAPDDAPLIIHESVDLDRCVPFRLDGMDVTPPARLAVDLGSVIRFERYRTVVERLRSDHGLTWIDLEREYHRHSIQGRNGCGALRDLLELHHETEGAADELVELLLVDLLAAAGLPLPVHQFHVQRDDGRSAYFDLAYPELRIAIETEGRIHLRADVNQADHERRNRLLLAGWTVLHFTYHDVTRRPAYVIDVIRRALRGAGVPI